MPTIRSKTGAKRTPPRAPTFKYTIIYGNINQAEVIGTHAKIREGRLVIEMSGEPVAEFLHFIGYERRPIEKAA